MLRTSRTVKTIGYLAFVAGGIACVTCRGHAALAVCVAVFMGILAVQGGSVEKNK